MDSRGICKTWLCATAVALAVMAVSISPAVAATPAVRWALHSIAQPTYFQASDTEDQYTLLVENVGSADAKGPVTVEDTLPAGITTSTRKPSVREEGWECEELGVGAHVVKCTLPPSGPSETSIPSLSQNNGKGVYNGGAIGIPIKISPDINERYGLFPLINEVTISGGGSRGLTREETEVGSPALVLALPFEPRDFSASALDASGALETQAAGHPAALTTTFNFSSKYTDEQPQSLGELHPAPAERVKQIVIDLPPGVVGDPQAAPKCSLTELQQAPNPVTRESVCEKDTQVGTLTLVQPPVGGGEPHVVAGLIVYNIIPEKGYPAEFGIFEPAFERGQLLYARLVGSGADAHVQIISGPLTEFLEFSGVSTIFYGNPGVKDQDQSGEKARAFFTNPSYCSPTGASFETTIHVDSWQRPGTFNSALLGSV